MNLKITIILLMAVLTTACSSSQKTPAFEEYLATNIRSDGSKEFYYTATMSNTGGSKRGGHKNVSGGMRVAGGSNSNTRVSGGATISGSGSGQQAGSRGRGGNSRPDEKISDQLEKKLLATGFCRDGWMETERHIQPPNVSVRGECNETATDRDRQTFPNTTDVSDQ